ncbi:hypothetical protein V5O48_005539 [Marasmius crinis-equi]|uniref:Extracellular membrane protein CFEM domain-containing protein n=1 Tax=Marasmius crinis-equi TaxID=585013 RepID=A0ABR3FMP9_9AGAR
MSVHFQLKNLPFSVLFLLQILSLAWGQASQAPPTTFGSDSITGSATTQGSGTPTSPASSSANSTSASGTQTSSQQLPTLGTYSPCLVTAFTLTVSDMNCTSVTQTDCYCRNASFADALISRMSSSDCPQEISTAENLAQQFCGLVSTSISFSVTSLPSPSGTSTSNQTSTAAPTSTTGTSSGSGSGNGNGNGAVSLSSTPGSAAVVALLSVALGVVLV